MTPDNPPSQPVEPAPAGAASPPSQTERDEATAAIHAAGLDVLSEQQKFEAAVREANDRCLRMQAELENFRKRSRRELDDERRYAALPLVRDMLAVLDNLQRAIDAAERSQSGAGLLEGVKMVATQLLASLDQHACKPIPAAGAPFDPNWHEAIGQIPSAEVAAGCVAQVARQGYMLHERVVRPAQVLVSTGQP